MGDNLTWTHGLTVGRLLDHIEKYKLSRDTLIMCQRVEDIYFENHGWSTLKKKGEEYHKAEEWNNDIDRGKYLDTDQYPLMKKEDLVKISPETMDRLKEEYYTIHNVIHFDDDYLYLSGHY